MKKEELQKIKKDIHEIFYGHGMCLCGHDEWCSMCSSSSAENVLNGKIADYLDELISKAEEA